MIDVVIDVIFGLVMSTTDLHSGNGLQNWMSPNQSWGWDVTLGTYFIITYGIAQSADFLPMNHGGTCQWLSWNTSKNQTVCLRKSSRFILGFSVSHLFPLLLLLVIPILVMSPDGLCADVNPYHAGLELWRRTVSEDSNHFPWWPFFDKKKQNISIFKILSGWHFADKKLECVEGLIFIKNKM